jgi:hypothetical protein
LLAERTATEPLEDEDIAWQDARALHIG